MRSFHDRDTRLRLTEYVSSKQTSQDNWKRSPLGGGCNLACGLAEKCNQGVLEGWADFRRTRPQGGGEAGSRRERERHLYCRKSETRVSLPP
jgi:hypothetical protein